MSPTKHEDETAKDSMNPDFLAEMGISPEEQQEMENAAHNGAADDIAQANGFYKPEDESSDIGSAEASGSTGAGSTKGDNDEQGRLSSFYNKSDEQGGGLKNLFSNASKKRKTIAAIAGGGMIGGVIALFGMFSSLNLDMFMKNIESKSFIRFQVDMEGRSSKWINAYITLRLMEVDDSSLTPEDRDNIIFRSNRVDTNSPLTDWYRTLRASKFEQEVFEKHGIRFSSTAYRDNEGRMRFRPAIISINDEQIKFDLTDEEKNAIDDAVNNNNLDVNKFNGRLSNFVDVQVLNSDKEGRRAIKKIVNENTKPWQFAKRYYTRKAIQNMTGVRDWRFFEKTREKWHDAKVSALTKIVKKSMPESTRSGKFIQCLFAILPSSECGSSTDPNDPANHSEPEGNSDDTSSGGDDEESKSKGFSSKTLNNIIAKTATKLSGPAAALDTINTLTDIDKQVKNGTLSKGVYAMRNAQAIAAFTTLGIAASQAHTGEISAEEYNEFMQIFSYAGTSEGWNTVITKSASSGSVSAAGFTEAKDKEEYCGDPHQEALKIPENKKAAEKEYHFMCDSQKIGASTNAKTFESSWQNSVGYVLGPLGSALDKTGAGWLLDKFNAVLGAVTGPIVNGALKGLGLSDNVEDVVGWAVGKVARFAGAVPLIDESSPGGVIMNHMIQGGAGAAEASSRLAGGALATETSMHDSQIRIAQYMKYKEQNMSSYDRYLSLDNTDSVLAAAITANATQSRSNLLTRTFSAVWKAPFNFATSRKTSAATTTGREAANFGEVKMYDIPSQCTDSNPLDGLQKDILPTMTNADDLGLIDASDLNWELMSDSAEFYGKLYNENPDAGDKIETVYNCAIFDNMARGATAGKHAPELAGSNAVEDASAGASSVSTGVGGTFTVATYNLPSKNGYGPTEWNRAVNLIKTAKVPGGQGMDIIGFQELRGGNSNFNHLKGALPNYDSWPKKANNPCAVPQAVFWNTNKFDFIKGEFLEYPRYNNLDTDCGPDGGGKIKHAHAQTPIVWLSTKAGQQVIFMNTHGAANGFGNNADGQPGGLDQSSERRMLSADIYIQKIEQLRSQNPGVPIVFTGDFNEGTGVRVRGNITYEFKQPNLFFCKVTAKKLMKITESPEKDCRKKNGMGGVDYIYVTPEVVIDKFKAIFGGKSVSGSDHPKTPVYTTITIPGSGGDAAAGGGSEVSASGFAWPVDKKYWDSDKGDFLDSHTTISGTFTSPYLKGAAVDISSPPLKAPVYSMLDGTVEKTNLCGAGEGMIIRSTVGGGTVLIAYGHGTSPRFKKGDKVKAGQRILDLGGVGCKVTGPHLHIDMTFNEKHVCPQDVFRAMGDNKGINLLDLSKKSRSPCD